jgi:hypothetical protein
VIILGQVVREGRVGCAEAPVLTVGVDQVVVEADLAGGRLVCPACGVGRLVRWGWARARMVRGVGRLRPRRGRCGHRGCGVTHVLLPVVCLVRRADGVEVVGAALEAAARGLGQRRVAELVGRSVSTVRGWLGRLAVRGLRVRAAFAVLVRALDPTGQVAVEAAGGVLAGPVVMIAAAARAAEGRWAGRVGVLSRWELVSFVTGGGLLLPGFVPESINASPRLPGS